MKSLIKKIDDLLVAITFAEAGEFESAADILGVRQDSISEEEEALRPGFETV